MGLTYQMKTKIPFDMADMNGHIKLPDVILLSLMIALSLGLVVVKWNI